MFFKDFMKNPQTTIALTFLTHIISGIDGVHVYLLSGGFSDLIIATFICYNIIPAVIDHMTFFNLNWPKFNLQVQYIVFFCAEKLEEYIQAS